MNLEIIKYIPCFPALAAVLCGLCSLKKSLRIWAAPACIVSIAMGFLVTMLVQGQVSEHGGQVFHLFDWIHAGNFHVDFSYFIDPLTIIMLCVVCGIGTLVAWYAAFYMSGDRGYARFFAFVSLFIFAMTNLVMADNLVLLYLGWEGVGVCSYLLIGYYYDKPSAVAAAKKAFIVNRIGDLGFAIGIFWAYQTFGTVSLAGDHGIIAQARELFEHGARPQAVVWIPFLLMLGAFGKSAQIPLYVWLPDAMEGPTPVSALIHAATMVTAGVYMIARLMPLFVLSPNALPVVAAVGSLTAIFAATIALCQYDIKRIYAYSTISQLGYMFVGVGVLSSVGGVFHLFTHAFFKALLFLTAGSVMHALAGQLDLRKMSGLRHKMPVTCWLMFIGCLALAGVPPFAGFYSKDMILAEAMERGLGPNGQWFYFTLAVMGLVTAFLTAFYTFRLWFRVFGGPEKYEMGDEHHGADDAHGQAGHGTDAAVEAHENAEGRAVREGDHAVTGAEQGASKFTVEHHHEPHEMRFRMNLPLFVLALGAIAAGYFGEHWIETMVNGSTASTEMMHQAGEAVETAGRAPLMFGYSVHAAMQVISTIIALTGIALAAFFHLIFRSAADSVASRNRGLVRLLANKYYIDQINDAAIVRPLRLLGEIFFAFDSLVIDGLVSLVGFVPRALGLSVRPSQRGMLQGYGVGMAFGAAVIVLLVIVATR